MSKKVRYILALALVLNLAFTGLALAQSVHWGYEGDVGPDHWAELSPDFALCAEGVEQSPIDIPAEAPTNATALGFDYQPSALTLLNNGHTIQAVYDDGSAVWVDGEAYKLLQFHFHTPSEHTVAGKSVPLELHLVHQNAEGGLAVVGVFLTEGAENPAFDAIFANLPAEEGEPESIDGETINAADLLPADQTYWRYDGSLTTPPCSEGVKWHVLTTPVEVSAEQIASFQDIFTNDARPVQLWQQREFIVVPATMPTTGVSFPRALPILEVELGTLVLFGATVAYAAYRRRPR